MEKELSTSPVIKQGDLFKKQAPQIIKKQNVDLVVYPDMSQIEDDVLKQIVTREREWWGYLGFGVYSICSDINCRVALSIDETYGVADNPKEYKAIEELEENGPKLDDCPDCGGPTELLCKQDNYFDYLRDHFKHGVFGVILFDKSGNVKGEAISSLGDLEKIFNSVNIRLLYDFEKWSTGLEKTIGTNNKIQQALCWERMGITPDFRGGSYFFDMTKIMFTLYPEFDNLPIICDTRLDSKAFALFRALGFNQIEYDKYGGVSLAIARNIYIIENLGEKADKFYKSNSNRIQKTKLRQKKKYIKNLGYYGARKFPGILI